MSDTSYIRSMDNKYDKDAPILDLDIRIETSYSMSNFTEYITEVIGKVKNNPLILDRNNYKLDATRYHKHARKTIAH